MIRGKGTTAKSTTVTAEPLKPVMSQTELLNLHEEKRGLEQSLKEAEGFGVGGPGEQIDKSRINAEIAHYDREIAKNSPKRTTAKTKDGFAREVKELEQKFKVGLPTRDEMAHPAKHPGAVRKHMKWLNENEKTGFVERYRTIQRIINPGEERSIEELRKDK